MAETRNAYILLVEKKNRREQLEDLDLDGRILK
jgi:hypothetical protein